MATDNHVGAHASVYTDTNTHTHRHTHIWLDNIRKALQQQLETTKVCVCVSGSGSVSVCVCVCVRACVSVFLCTHTHKHRFEAHSKSQAHKQTPEHKPLQTNLAHPGLPGPTPDHQHFNGYQHYHHHYNHYHHHSARPTAMAVLINVSGQVPMAWTQMQNKKRTIECNAAYVFIATCRATQQ
jgi:hypothetical protein